MGTLVDLSSLTFDYDVTSFTAQWTFNSTNPLPAAFYTIALDSSSIAADGFQLDGNGDGSDGDDFVMQHYVAIPGDANLDGQVDVLNDAFVLVENLGTSQGGSFESGDFNNDQAVDVLRDAFILVANLGRSVLPPASAFRSAMSSASPIEQSDVYQNRDIVFTSADFQFGGFEEEEKVLAPSGIGNLPLAVYKISVSLFLPSDSTRELGLDRYGLCCSA